MRAPCEFRAVPAQTVLECVRAAQRFHDDYLGGCDGSDSDISARCHLRSIASCACDCHWFGNEVDILYVIRESGTLLAFELAERAFERSLRDALDALARELRAVTCFFYHAREARYCLPRLTLTDAVCIVTEEREHSATLVLVNECPAPAWDAVLRLRVAATDAHQRVCVRVVRAPRLQLLLSPPFVWRHAGPWDTAPHELECTDCPHRTKPTALPVEATPYEFDLIRAIPGNRDTIDFVRWVWRAANFAAARIQHAFRRANVDPKFPLCRRRLLAEFDELAMPVTP